MYNINASIKYSLRDDFGVELPGSAVMLPKRIEAPRPRGVALRRYNVIYQKL